MTTADTTDPRFGFETRQVHAGEKFAADRPRITPIHASAGYLFDSFDHAQSRFAGEDPGFVYSRTSNPTNAVAEQRLAALEGGVGAVLTGSGQAAATVAFLSIVGAGDHILSSAHIYEGTRNLFRRTFARLGIETDFVQDAGDPSEWARLIRPNTKALFGEPVSNPTNELLDVTAVAEVAHRHGIPLVIDNTIPTPYLHRPVEHGADIVVHSTSKFLAGHGAAIGGAIVDGGTFPWHDHADRYPYFDEQFRSGKNYWEAFGPKVYWGHTRSRPAADIGPHYPAVQAFQLLQGIDTLSLRMERHASNALAVAQWLEEQPEVSYVNYTGLKSSSQHHLAERYLPRGAGSVFSFDLAGSRDAARTLIDSVELFSRMTHIGDVRSLILNPATTTHSRLTQAERDELRVGPGLVRLSVGIESVEDLIADLDLGFRALRRRRPAGAVPPAVAPAAVHVQAQSAASASSRD
ncbi:MAG TPA: PLP-dependent transferase [Trebonia sp.]|jgi:O-acetylhomoserine (thiol)-lyase